MTRLRTAFIAFVLAGTTGTLALAAQPPQAPQPQRQQPPGAGALADAPPITAGEIQRWFDAYALEQAQDALNLNEGQYGRFVTRLKAVQETRRRHLQVRNAILVDLRRLTDPKSAPGDDAAIRDRIRALRDEEDRSAADLRKAYEGVDEILDVRQQARFRLFEEQMERRKLELLMRARQNARARRAGGKH
jgi:transglutaminase-like putative cysteine protease